MSDELLFDPKKRFAISHKNYELKNVKEPNLFREFFPYDSVPRIPFDNTMVTLNPAKKFRLSDTTFRDGQQSRPPYSVKQISEIFDYLHRLSGPNGIIEHSEFFLYTEKDRQAVDACRAKGYKFPQITGWIRANKNDFKLVKEMELEETGILTSVSDYHIFLKLGWNRQQAIDNYMSIVYAALEAGITPRLHFEDITRADIYGFVIPFVQQLVRLQEETHKKIRVRLCDTMGYGVSYQMASLPRSVPKIIQAVTQDGGMPGENLEWHGHNDFHRSFANATYAWMYGCQSVNGTLLGYGERTGNTPIEAMIMEYLSLTGDNSMDTTAITDVAKYFQKMGFDIPENYPFVGSDFNVTKAGIHVDGLIKNEEIYNIFDTEKILNRPLGIAITDKSGVAGVAKWLNNHLRLTGEEIISKKDPGVIKINKEIMKQYDEGRVTSISNNELEKMARKYLPQYFISDLDKIIGKEKEFGLAILHRYTEHPDFMAMDQEQMELVMKNLIHKDPFINFAYVVDTEGHRVTKNITQITDKSKYDKHLIDKDYSDRDWFIEVMQTGREYISPVFTSKITNKLTITLSGAIFDKEENIVGILGIDFNFESFAKVEGEDSL